MHEYVRQRIADLATEIRIAELEMFAALGFGHIGGSLSITDLLAVLYGGAMRFDAQRPDWPERDRLIVSKGHAGPAVYAALSLCGFFPREMLYTLNQGGTYLPSHCDRNKTPGIDVTTGSLGQGASTACGVAEAHRDERELYTYLILGDGECQEGQIWEAAMYAAMRRLKNLITFVDRNQKQLDGFTEDVMALENLAAKFKAFGWNVMSIDGHDHTAIYEAIAAAKAQENDRPSAIILNTIKGRGVAFVEEAFFNHHMTVSKEQAEEAIRTLRGGKK